MAGKKRDKELEAYRNLIKPPEQFRDGFGWHTIVAALFLALIVTPGSLYISLVAGEGVGPAARWVTIVLFAEIAKRSLRSLTKQQSFVIFYMTGHVLIQNAMQTGLLWNLFLTQSDSARAMGIASQIPSWIMPAQVAAGADVSTFLKPSFLFPILYVCSSMIIARIDHFGLSYFLYRLTTDVERLPFPMAPISASGMMSLAETEDESEKWRPACFAIGSMLGLLFGFVYLGIPTLTSVLFQKPVYLIPLPWVELTPAIKDILPATALNIVPNLTFVILGMVLPFWAVAGGFIGLILTFILNPILYHQGILNSWRPGMQTVDTLFSNHIDFYLSFSLGITFFIAALGLIQTIRPVLKAVAARRRNTRSIATTGDKEADDPSTPGWRAFVEGNPARGDISVWVSLAIYVLSTITYISLSAFLVKGFPVVFFLIYGFLYTPLMGYAAAKVEGLAGQTVAIPMVKEASFILSGYKGVAIWFAPIPMHNYGTATRGFKVMELTGTRVKSLIKTDLVCMPIILVSLVLFSSLIISQGPLNSDLYPYVQKVWDLQARNQCVMMSATLEGKRSIFIEALKPSVVGIGFLGSAAMYAVLSAFSLPVLLIYGVVRGLGQTNPMGLIPEMLGALLGRYYFRKKFGDRWREYTPAIFAGFTCGMGLMGMAGVALRLLAMSISPVQY